MRFKLLFRGFPPRASETFLSFSESDRVLFPLVGMYLQVGTRCRGACEAGLNWRRAHESPSRLQTVEPRTPGGLGVANQAHSCVAV